MSGLSDRNQSEISWTFRTSHGPSSGNVAKVAERHTRDGSPVAGDLESPFNRLPICFVPIVVELGMKWLEVKKRLDG